MKHNWKWVGLIGLTGAIFLMGCESTPEEKAGDTAFISFEGEQQDWPVEQNAMVEREFSVPVYHGLPSQPYEIVGRIIGTQGSVVGRSLAKGLWSDRDRLENVAMRARLSGANAVVLTKNEKIMNSLQVREGEMGEVNQPLYNFDGAVVAVKLQPQEAE